MNWMDMIPWLTGGAALAAIVRQAVVMPWSRAREKERELFHREMEQLTGEIDRLRKDLRLMTGDMYALRKDMGLMMVQPWKGDSL